MLCPSIVKVRASNSYGLKTTDMHDTSTPPRAPRGHARWTPVPVDHSGRRYPCRSGGNPPRPRRSGSKGSDQRPLRTTLLPPPRRGTPPPKKYKIIEKNALGYLKTAFVSWGEKNICLVEKYLSQAMDECWDIDRGGAFGQKIKIRITGAP